MPAPIRKVQVGSRSINAIIKNMKGFKGEVQEIINETNSEMGPKLVKEVQSRTPKRTGKLQKSTKFKVDDKTGSIYVTQNASNKDKSSNYAKFVEYGTGTRGEEDPHPSLPRTGWEYDYQGIGYIGQPHHGQLYYSQENNLKAYKKELKKRLRKVGARW